MENIPPEVRTALWSYDSDALDLSRNKTLIIHNVLDHGTLEAVRWLRRTYSHADLRDTFATSMQQSWSPKSLHYWSVIFGCEPSRQERIPTAI